MSERLVSAGFTLKSPATSADTSRLKSTLKRNKHSRVSNKTLTKTGFVKSIGVLFGFSLNFSSNLAQILAQIWFGFSVSELKFNKMQLKNKVYLGLQNMFVNL